jgi:hypothetical protein
MEKSNDQEAVRQNSPRHRRFMRHRRGQRPRACTVLNVDGGFGA